MCDLFGEIAKYLQTEDQYSLIIAYPRKFYLQQYDYSDDLINILITNNAANIIKKIYKTKLCCNDILQWAARNGHLDVVKFLVTLPKVDASAYDNYAIRWAAANGHLDVVKYLASLPNVDASANNNYAIYWAAKNGHLEVVKFLVTLSKVDVSADDNYAIRYAVIGNHL